MCVPELVSSYANTASIQRNRSARTVLILYGVLLLMPSNTLPMLMRK